MDQSSATAKAGKARLSSRRWTCGGAASGVLTAGAAVGVYPPSVSRYPDSGGVNRNTLLRASST
jgi:hypothetical protein